MAALFIPTEEDIKTWVATAVKEAVVQILEANKTGSATEEPFMSREEILIHLKISISTLRNWQLKGLPHYKINNRVYFLRSEVFEHIKKFRLELHAPG